jgi:hypothetical protein
MTKHQEEIANWLGSGSVDPDRRIFAEEIGPWLSRIPVRRMMSATGLSEDSCYRIRRREVVPHSRHWAALRALGTDLAL